MILNHLPILTFLRWWESTAGEEAKIGPHLRQNEHLKHACDYLSKDSKTTGVESDEYLTIAKVWGNKLKYLHPIQHKIAEKAINDNIRSGYGNLAQRIRANQLPVSYLGFVESKAVRSFTYPCIPIPATQNSDQRCAPTFPTYASELRCSFFLLRF
jgi:hypothetical protein